jgi:hypothetical protein
MDMKTIIVAIIFTILIFLIYKFILNPQIVDKQQNQCPTGWIYSDPLCTPTYQTSCSAFNPSKMTSRADKISFSERCGVRWP